MSATVAALIRVVIVDDQEIVRAGLARILSPEDGFDVVGSCSDGQQALAAVEHDRPDLLLMDVRMPGMDGIEAVNRLGELTDPPPVLMVTTFDEDDVLWGALESGAAGFVLKDASAADLIAAARTVAGGGAWLDPAVAPRVLSAYRRAVAPRERQEQRFDQLTEREHEVLRCVARGANNAETAEQLFVSEPTVKSHLGSIFTKLGVRDRASLIVLAYDHGVVSPGNPPQI